jgi:hypothetical protein
VATGELTRVEVDPSTLPVGAVVTNSGRVSAAKMYEPHAPTLPFTPVQLSSLDEALTLASRTTGLDFSVYLGELGPDSRARAEELHAGTPRPTHAVLIAVSPGERKVEVVTGEESHRRVADRGAKLAVMSMVASFKEGDLSGGLVSGLRMLTDQAGKAPKHS